MYKDGYIQEHLPYTQEEATVLTIIHTTRYVNEFGAEVASVIVISS